MTPAAPLTGERAAECERALWGESAAWRRVFASSVVPEPTAEPGRGDIMGRMTAGSIARVLRLEADEGLLAAARLNLAALNTRVRGGATHAQPRSRGGRLLLLAGAQGRSRTG